MFLHRATPIVHGAERVIINTCWASANDTRNADEIDRGSMTEAFV
ncbi:HalD/BesD family halogenase [Candidatus Spongiihabitans sp.]